MAKTKSVEELIPLPPQSYHVLVTLGTETLHGYGIIEAFEELTDGRETLLPGSLYQTLSRMVAEGLLEEAEAPADAGSRGPRRRYYRLTELGRKVARAESRRRQLLLEHARQRRLAPDPNP